LPQIRRRERSTIAAWLDWPRQTPEALDAWRIRPTTLRESDAKIMD
jgi:hypothetical protein